MHPPMSGKFLRRPERPPMISIAIVDVDCGIDRKRLYDWTEATQIFVTRDVSRAPPFGWGMNARIRLAPSVEDLLPGEWLCGLYKSPDTPGALGYHDETLSGMPVIKCFPLLDTLDNACVTITHEVVETMVDPLLSTASVGQDGVIRAREAADPVETTTYEIEVSSGAKVKVTNFVLPAYFEPPFEYSKVPMDFLRLIRKPGEILDGGYQLTLKNGQWVTDRRGELSPYRQRVHSTSGRNHRRSVRPFPPQPKL